MKILLTLNLVALIALSYVVTNHAHADNNDDHKRKTTFKAEYYYYKSDGQYCRAIKNGWISSRCQDSPFEDKPEEASYDESLPGNNYSGKK